MNPFRQRGFTLIELLIVITVSVMLLTVVAGSYTNFFFASVINGEVDSLVSILRLAKSKSMAEVDDLSYQVVVTSDSFRLETAGGGNQIEVHRLNTQSVVTSGSVTIVFDKITGTTSSCTPTCTITIGNNPATTQSKSVVVSDQGIITVL